MNKIKIRPPWWLRILFPGVTWRGDKSRKCVYLTFDDGPIPEVTPAVLEILGSRDVKATFFCVGENVEKYPEVYAMHARYGMKTGNHTFSHSKAFSMCKEEYFKDIDRAQEHIDSKFFRPPHGQLYPWYLLRLKKKFEKVVMWDLITEDYRKDLNAEDIFNRVVKFVRPGSVIVFHDSLKAWPRLEKALPRTLDYLIGEGYFFKLL